MSAEVVAIGPRATLPGPNEQVIERIRRVLNAAERGEVRAVAIATVTTPGGTACAYTSGDLSDWSTLLGSVRLLEHRMLSEGSPG